MTPVLTCVVQHLSKVMDVVGYILMPAVFSPC